MEFLKFLVDKLFSVKTWKQIWMLCFMATYFALGYVVFENRENIFKVDQFDIPESRVQYVQKDLEIERILSKIMYNTKADRAYLVKFQPQFDKNNLNGKIQVYLTHEQVNTGVKSIKELYEGTLLTKFDTNWVELYYEGNQTITTSTAKDYAFMEYHMDKANIETFSQFAVYNDINQVTHALILEFNSDKVLNIGEKDVIRKYINILGHYFK